MHTRTTARSPALAIAGLLLVPACGHRPAPEPVPESAPGSASRGRLAGAPAPKWTQIEGVRECTGQILEMFVCTPSERPANCAEAGWTALNALSGDDALTPCALEPDLVACTVDAEVGTPMRCFPDARPAACSEAMWQRVKDVRIVSMCRDVPRDEAPGSGP